MKRLIYTVLVVTFLNVHGMQKPLGWETSYKQACCTDTCATAGCLLQGYSCLKGLGSVTGCCKLSLLGACEVHPVTGCCCGLWCLIAAAAQGTPRFKGINHFEF